MFDMVIPPPVLSTGRAGGFVALEQSLRLQPFRTALGPGRARLVRGPHAEAVPSRSVDVHLGRNAGAFKCQIHAHAIFRCDRIIVGMSQKHWRTVLPDANVGVEYLFVSLG